MTIHHLPRSQRDHRPAAPPQPRRSGQPWTTGDYETLVNWCRTSDDLTELAAALERTESAVVLRAKRLLPLDQRGAPDDRVITHLHALLRDDDDYDWAHHLAATPPPRPVVNHLPAPEVRRGIPGLSDEELLAVAGLAVRVGGDSLSEELRHDLSITVARRDLDHRLAHDLTRDLARDSARWLEAFRRRDFYQSYPHEWHAWEPDPEPDPFGVGPHPDHDW